MIWVLEVLYNRVGTVSGVRPRLVQYALRFVGFSGCFGVGEVRTVEGGREVGR